MSQLAEPVVAQKSIICPPLLKEREHVITDDERTLPLLGVRRVALLIERDGVTVGVESRVKNLTREILEFLRAQILPDVVRTQVQESFALVIESGEASPELEALLQIHGDRLARFIEIARPDTCYTNITDRHDLITRALLGHMRELRRKDSRWVEDSLTQAGKAGLLLRLLTVSDAPENYPHLHSLAQADAPKYRGAVSSFWP